MDTAADTTGPFVIGVDTHKELHVAAVVDEHDRIVGSQSFATTRQGYKQMLAWMRTLGLVRRVGVEATGSLGPHDPRLGASAACREPRRRACRSLHWRRHARDLRRPLRGVPQPG